MNRENDFKNFSAMWIAIQEMYGKPTPPITVKMAFNVLSKWSLFEVSQAVEHYISTPGKFRAPLPSDVIMILLGGTGEDLGQLAWTRVEKAVREIGPYASIASDDRIIMAVIRDMGGWIKMCARDNERSMEFAGKEFARRYASYVASGLIPEHLDSLPGIAERDCISSGYAQSAPDPVTLPGTTPSNLKIMLENRESQRHTIPRYQEGDLTEGNKSPERLIAKNG